MAGENELVIYAKIGNREGLSQAVGVFHQEQAQIRAPRGRIRVRMERPDDGEWSYVMTTKKGFKKVNGVQECDEENKDIDAGAYAMFRSVCDCFQRKTRYIFNIENISISAPNFTGTLTVPNMKYEVDVFFKADGTQSEWCKIDVEVDALHKALADAGISIGALKTDLVVKLSQLPFQPKDAFMEDPNNPKTKELISAIFDNEFNRMFTDGATEGVAEASPLTNAFGRAMVRAMR